MQWHSEEQKTPNCQVREGQNLCPTILSLSPLAPGKERTEVACAPVAP